MNTDYPDYYSNGAAPCTTAEDPDIFIPGVGDPNYVQKIKDAKKFCEDCPYKLACFQYAYENDEPGVWGGTSQPQRQAMKRRAADGFYRRIEPESQYV